MAETLMLTCKNCGTTFPSPLQMDRRIFEDARPGDMDAFRGAGDAVPDEVLHWHSLRADVTCPSCGQTHAYEKPDYSFPEA